MAAAARQSIVLADSSKVGSEHFSRFASLEDISVLVTDTGLDIETAQELEAHGPEVIRA